MQAMVGCGPGKIWYNDLGQILPGAMPLKGQEIYLRNVLELEKCCCFYQLIVSNLESNVKRTQFIPESWVWRMVEGEILHSELAIKREIQHSDCSCEVWLDTKVIGCCGCPVTWLEFQCCWVTAVLGEMKNPSIIKPIHHADSKSENTVRKVCGNPFYHTSSDLVIWISCQCFGQY